ncbi:MAG: hypothetical protein Q4F21_03030 [Lachnospiraceae bacterium]|nr:hypothetical protein [Lachnospiraceae bacterium]
MAHKKNGFWTFIFSLLPGAGEMYLGFMKQGISLMTLFFGIITFCAYFGFEAGIFVLPIVWFYSFFHVHNLNGLSDEEFAKIEDDFLFHVSDYADEFNLTRKKQKILAYGCIIIGVYALWNMTLDLLYSILPELPYAAYDFIYAFTHRVPQAVISLLLIFAGLHLIRGKKAQLDEEETEEERFRKNAFEKDDRNDFFQDETKNSQTTVFHDNSTGLHDSCTADSDDSFQSSGETDYSNFSDSSEKEDNCSDYFKNY